MVRKLLAASAAVLFSGAAALAANVPSIPLATSFTATAAASWATTASSITLNAVCPSGLQVGALVIDTTLSPNAVIGSVAGCVGKVLALQQTAAVASSGSTDALKIGGAPVNWNEPGQALNNLNYVIGLVNGNSGGLIAALPAPVTTSGTGANTILTTVVTLPQPGQAIHVKAWGVNSADANAKTVTINFGASGTAAVAVTASGAAWWVDGYIQNVGTIASPAWQMVAYGAEAATLITAAQANGTDALATTPQTLNITGTAATSGTMTFDGAYFEYVK